MYELGRRRFGAVGKAEASEAAKGAREDRVGGAVRWAREQIAMCLHTLVIRKADFCDVPAYSRLL